jgi:hypothetical protein
MIAGRDFGSDSCNCSSAILLLVAVAIALIGVGVCPARAQPVPPTSGQPAQPPAVPSDFQVLVTPYGWLPWIPATVKPSNPRIPSSSVTIDPYELVSHLTWVPFMGAVEFRDGPFGLALDYIHAPVKAGISTHGILFGGGTGGTTIDSGTAMVFYRPIARPDQFLDLGIGVRAWGIGGDISLDQGRLLPAVSVSNGVSWAVGMVRDHI